MPVNSALGRAEHEAILMAEGQARRPIRAHLAMVMVDVGKISALEFELGREPHWADEG
jgi:hypothetical protein